MFLLLSSLPLFFLLLSHVSPLSTPLPNLAIPGGGIYYYHLAGQLKFLREEVRPGRSETTSHI